MNDKVFTSPIVISLLGSGRLGKLTAVAENRLSERGENFYPSSIENEFFERAGRLMATAWPQQIKVALIQMSDFFLEATPVVGEEYLGYIHTCVKVTPKDGELTVGFTRERLRRSGLLLGGVTPEWFLVSMMVDRAFRAVSAHAVQAQLLSMEEVAKAIAGDEGNEVIL